MRIVRVEQIAPGGAPLEVHERLTLLRGMAPEARRRLVGTFGALAGLNDPEVGGLIEVSGVQLALDAPTLAQLKVDVQVDPILRLDTSAAPTPSPVTAGTVNGADLPPPGPIPAPRPAAVEGLRGDLRTVSAARTELGRHMEQVRAGLDSFSTASLEVCIGQIDALESRRSSLRIEWERHRSIAEHRRATLRSGIERARTVRDRVKGLDPDPVERTADAIRRFLETPPEPDPEAIELADRLDTTMRQIRDMAGRRAKLRIRESEAAQRLDEAISDAHAAEQSMRAPVVDHTVVRRLEAVRDEIFSVDDRQGRLGSARNKRKLAELRSEEAILLDRLGFDTYSSYVMGIPSVRAELERSSRLESAQDQADRISEEIERIRHEAPESAEIEQAAAGLAALLARSLDALGSTAPRPGPDQMVVGGALDERAADAIYAATAELRRRRVVANPADVPHVTGLADQLADQLADWAETHDAIEAASPHVLVVAASGPAVADDPPAEDADGSDDGVAVVLDGITFPRLPAPPSHGRPGPATPTELVGLADAWLAWRDSLGRWFDEVEHTIGLLDARLGELLGSEPDADIARWAEVEADLDAALDRLAIAQDRVRAHEDATAELAELRTEELRLRDQERSLLQAIATLESAPSPTAAPMPPPYRSGTPLPGSTRAVESAAVDAAAVESAAVDAAADDAAAVDAEWQVVERLARQRSVSFVGSLPVMVDALPRDHAERSAVLERLDRMSDLIQVVVVSDDDSVAAWASGLGGRCTLVDLSR